MSLTINHNTMAQNAYGNFSRAYGSLGTSIERISSGYRINNASDDAAGLAIREMMRADIATTQQGLRNAADAISMLETADGSLAIIDEKLIRMKELAEQAATATYTTAQRDMINSEYQAMAREIDRIANATEFNGIKLLDGSVSNMNGGQGLDIHFGTGNDDGEDSYFVNLGDARATSTTGLQVGGDAKNDIWGQGGAASGEIAGPGCCTAGFTSLNTKADFTSGDSFSFGYNWDWREEEDTALDSGRYLAGRYTVKESESLQDLVNKVNKGTQSRVGIEMDAATLRAGVVSGGTVAICVGDESYIFGSAALAQGEGTEGWKSEITSKEFGMIGNGIVSESEAHRLSAAGYTFKGITGKGESDLTGNAGSAAALSDAVADANKKLEDGVSVTVSGDRVDIAPAAVDGIKLSDTTDSKGGTVDIEDLWIDKFGNWTQDSAVATAMGFHQAKVELTLATGENSANMIGKATLKFGTNEIDITTADMKLGDDISAIDLAAALNTALAGEGLKGHQFSEGSRLIRELAPLGGTITAGDLGTEAYTLAAATASDLPESGLAIKNLFIKDDGTWTKDADLAAAEGYKQAFLKMTKNETIPANIGTATVHYGDKTFGLGLGTPPVETEFAADELATAINEAFTANFNAADFPNAGKEQTYTAAPKIAVVDVDTTKTATTDTALTIPVGGAMEITDINDLWINQLTGAWTDEKEVADTDPTNWKSGKVSITMDIKTPSAIAAGATATFGTLILDLATLEGETAVDGVALSKAIVAALNVDTSVTDDDKGKKTEMKDPTPEQAGAVQPGDWAAPDFDDKDNYTGENEEVKAASLVDNTKDVYSVATAEDSLDKFTTSALASAINNNSASQFWAMTETVEFTNEDGDQEVKEMLYVFTKVGGNLNSLEACERTSKDDGGKEAGTGVDFENVQSGNFNSAGTTFSLGGEDWATMTPVQTKERNGHEVWNVTLDGRDVGSEYDLRIVDRDDITTPGMINRPINGMDRDSFLEIQNAADAEYAGAEVRSQSTAQEALVALDSAILAKDTIRADIGAMMNRLENTMTNLTVQSENLMASESRISDVDIAKEMTEFTKNNTMAQAANSMLAQANSITSMALSLIQG